MCGWRRELQLLFRFQRSKEDIHILSGDLQEVMQVNVSALRDITRQLLALLLRG